MAKTVVRKASSKRAGGKPPRRSGRFIAICLGLLGFLCLAELVSFVLNKASAPKEYYVQDVMEFSGDSQTCGAFKAWDILAKPDGFVISDQGNKRLLVFDRQGKFVQEIGQKQAGSPPLGEVSCLTLDSTGNVFVMDTWNGLIRGFDPKGRAVLTVDLNNKSFYGPRGVAWDGANFIVADTGSHRVAKVSPSGAVIAAWGKHGSSKGDYNNPYETAVDGQGTYYILDQDNHRIQCLDPQGKFLREIRLGAPPTAEAVDSQRKILYVSSNEGHFIKAYSLDGNLIGILTEAGKSNAAIPDARALSVMDNGDLATVSQGKATVYHPVPAPQPAH